MEVLKEMVKVANIQFIAVDDGSTDQAARQAKSALKGVKFLGYAQNRGKTHAVRYGLDHVTTPYVLLFDADLVDFDHREVAAGIKYMTSHPNLDCLIFRLADDPFIFKALRTDLIFTGQRMLKTADLKTILKQKVDDYDLEFAVNRYLIENQKYCAAMDFHARHILKLEKWPLGLAIKKIWQFQTKFWRRDLLWYWWNFRPEIINPKSPAASCADWGA